jgi:DNA replication protein DnaC
VASCALPETRTLLEAELGARGASNARARLRAGGFPVTKTLDEFRIAERSILRATFDYLASLEWIRAWENLVLVGPAGTGKSHTLIALGHAAVETGFRPATTRPRPSPRRSTGVSPTTASGGSSRASCGPTS